MSTCEGELRRELVEYQNQLQLAVWFYAIIVAAWFVIGSVFTSETLIWAMVITGSSALLLAAVMQLMYIQKMLDKTAAQ